MKAPRRFPLRNSYTILTLEQSTRATAGSATIVVGGVGTTAAPAVPWGAGDIQTKIRALGGIAADATVVAVTNAYFKCTFPSGDPSSLSVGSNTLVDASAVAVTVSSTRLGTYSNPTTAISTLPADETLDGDIWVLVAIRASQVVNTSGNIKLANGTWTSVAAYDTLTLCCDGTYWHEVSRTPSPSADVSTLEQAAVLPSSAFRASVVKRTGQGASQAPTSGRMYLTSCYFRAGEVITGFKFLSHTTALASGTHSWGAIYSLAGSKLAQGTDDTSPVWAASSYRDFPVAYTTLTSGLFLIGFMVAASTMPTLVAVTQISSQNAAAPILGAQADTGLTTTAPGTATMSGAAFVFPGWAY